MLLEIKNDLIANNFPELKRKIIFIQYRSGKKHNYYYMRVRWFLGVYIIQANKEILTFSKAAIKACMAHELAHIVIGTHLVKSKTEIERDADTLVLKRGLGKELLQFHNDHNKTYKSYKADDGLTKREIKLFLKGR